MLESPNQKKSQKHLTIGVGVFFLAAVVGLIGSYLISQNWMDHAPLLPQLTEESKAYLPNLELKKIQISAEESFLKQTIVRIEGELTNQGKRYLRSVDIHCVFREAYGQEVGRELVRIVGRQNNQLGPRETQFFRLAFDSVPTDWNQALPDLYVAQMIFED